MQNFSGTWVLAKKEPDWGTNTVLLTYRTHFLRLFYRSKTSSSHCRNFILQWFTTFTGWIVFKSLRGTLLFGWGDFFIFYVISTLLLRDNVFIVWLMSFEWILKDLSRWSHQYQRLFCILPGGCVVLFKIDVFDRFLQGKYFAWIWEQKFCWQRLVGSGFCWGIGGFLRGVDWFSVMTQNWVSIIVYLQTIQKGHLISKCLSVREWT